MKKMFAILSLAICLSIASEIYANQYDGQCVDPCIGQCEPTSGRIYAGAFGGANWMNRARIDGVRLKSKVGFTGGLSLGYAFDNGFRVEGEISYRKNSLHAKHSTYNLSSSSEKDKDHGSLHSWSYMANFLYDFNDVTYYMPNVVPYLGVGFGYTRNHSHVKGHSYHKNSHESSNGFAYQGIAGVGYRLTDSTTLAVEYRYFAGKNHAHDHGVNIALRQSF